MPRGICRKGPPVRGKGPEASCSSASTPPAGKRVIHFAPSPKMSTYLVAFVVGEFDFVQVRPSLSISCTRPPCFAPPSY
jgi:hypothetical protein